MTIKIASPHITYDIWHLCTVCTWWNIQNFLISMLLVQFQINIFQQSLQLFFEFKQFFCNFSDFCVTISFVFEKIKKILYRKFCKSVQHSWPAATIQPFTLLNFALTFPHVLGWSAISFNIRESTLCTYLYTVYLSLTCVDLSCHFLISGRVYIL